MECRHCHDGINPELPHVVDNFDENTYCGAMCHYLQHYGYSDPFTHPMARALKIAETWEEKYPPVN